MRQSNFSADAAISRTRSILDISRMLICNDIERIRKELSALPESSLSINNKNGKVYFTETQDRRRRGITQDKKRVHDLARKKFLQRQLLLLEDDMQLFIRRTSDKSPSLNNELSDLIAIYEQAGLDIPRILLTPKQYSWMHSSYRENPYHPEERKYTTLSGKKVRSKSERSIADQILSYGLAYRYEQACEIDVSSFDGMVGTRQGRYKTYYPDFIVMKPSGEKVIWEHFGLLHIPEYRSSSFEKLFAYRQLGDMPERNLIFTVEADLTDINSINEIIERRILLGI